METGPACRFQNEELESRYLSLNAVFSRFRPVVMDMCLPRSRGQLVVILQYGTPLGSDEEFPAVRRRSITSNRTASFTYADV